MLESGIESKFKKLVEAYGCFCLKILPSSFVGLPDRMVIGPNRYIVFFELKKPKGEPSPMQLRWRKWLKGFGFEIHLTYTYEEVATAFLDSWQRHLKNQ